MRRSFFVLAAAAFLLGACGEPPKTSTRTAQSVTVHAEGRFAADAVGKLRIALLLPLSGRAAPIGQAMLQAAEWRCSTAAPRKSPCRPTTAARSAETAVEAYRKAPLDGAALVLGPLSTARRPALLCVGQPGRHERDRFLERRAGRAARRLDHGNRRPAAGPRVVDHAFETGIRRFATFAPQTPYGEQMGRTLETYVTTRGVTVVGREFFDPSGLEHPRPGA